MKKAALAALVLVAVVTAWALRLHERLRDLLDWIGALGFWAPGVFAAIYVVATVLFVPGSVLTLGAGVLFDVGWGTLIVSVASTLGACAAFLIGRYVARDWVARRVESNPKFRAIDEAVAARGWKIVLLARLSPVFPFNMLNYALGLTKVPFRSYALASWLGMLPGTLMYVYLGAALGDLAMADRERTPLEWSFFGAGLVATIAVTAYVTRTARKAMADVV